MHDLESGSSYPAGRADFYTAVGLGGSALYQSGANAGATASLKLLRFTESGFLPLAPVAGYESVPGNFYSEGSLSDARFQLFRRRSSGNMAVEVVDSLLARRHGFVADPYDYDPQTTPAPSGYYFISNFYQNVPNTRVGAWGWAKVTQSGVTPYVRLPDDTVSAIFSGDGRYLYFERGAPFVLNMPLPTRALHVVRLPERAGEQPLQLAGIAWPTRMWGGPGASLWLTARPEGSDNDVWYQLAPSGSLQPLTDPTRDALSYAANAELQLAVYSTGSTQRIELVVPSSGARHLVAELPSDPLPLVQLTARHVLYVAQGALHALGVDGAGTHDVVVSEAAERTPTPVCWAQHGDLLTFQASDGGIVFVSLADAVARRLGKLELPAGAQGRTCMLKHPKRSLFLYTQLVAAKRQVWVVNASPDTLGSAQLELELDSPVGTSIGVQLFGG